VDGFKKFYTELAKQQGKTLEELQAEQEKHGKQAVSDTQMQLYRGALQLFNAGVGVYNWTLGFVLPNVGYRSVPPNHMRIIDTLVQVHGYEIFELGTFNGDPHPGNIWLMDDGSLGLIDYGPVKELTPHQIRDLAKLVVALSSDDSQAIVRQFAEFGFRSERMDPWVVERTARYYFQDDTNPELLTRKDGTRMVRFATLLSFLNWRRRTFSR
jgi:aarF domain-containing kinase